jgi:hypothetical protein
MDKEQADNVRNVLGEDGTIRFGVKTKNTPENVAIHENFKRFCEQECNNDYTLGLKFLLNAIASDYKYESLSERITYLKTELDELRIEIENSKKNFKKKDEDRNAF